MAETQTTRLSRRWLIKISIFLIGLPALGLWGLYDATVAYPRRGEMDASRRLFDYIAARPLTVGIEDPQQTYSQLAARQGQLDDAARARLAFLVSLKRMWKLNVETIPLRLLGPDSKTHVMERFDIRKGRAFTVGPDGKRQYKDLSTTLSELRRTWEKSPTPTPLDNLDLLFQWLIAGVGLIAWLYPIGLFVRAARTKYRWDPDTMRLTLPDGSSIVPDDIEEFDKRRWHKFYVTLRLKQDKTLTLDLLKHEPLEQWILEMEKAKGGPADEGEEPGAESGEGESEEPAGDRTQASEAGSEPSGGPDEEAEPSGDAPDKGETAR